MPDPRISEDSIHLISRLVNEAEDMKDAANQSLKDTWAEHREVLKSLGLSGAEVSAEVAQFKAAIAARRMSQSDKDKAMTKAEGVEGYLAILDAPRARARTRDEEITEPQHAPHAVGDLTRPARGQVATYPEAKASDDGGTTAQGIEAPADSVTGDVSRASDSAGSVAPIQPETEAPYVPQPMPGIEAFAGSSNGRTTAFDAANAGSIPAPASNIATFQRKPIRPHCLRPDACGGQGREHCWFCKKAMAEAGVA